MIKHFVSSRCETIYHWNRLHKVNVSTDPCMEKALQTICSILFYLFWFAAPCDEVLNQVMSWIRVELMLKKTFHPHPHNIHLCCTQLRPHFIPKYKFLTLNVARTPIFNKPHWSSIEEAVSGLCYLLLMLVSRVTLSPHSTTLSTEEQKS